MRNLFKSVSEFTEMLELDWVTKSLIIGFAIVFVLATIAVITMPPEPTAIDVFSTRFDECMATERFTRDECVIYAKGE